MHSQPKSFRTFVKAISEEFYLRRICCYRFLPIHLKEQFLLDVGNNVLQGLFRACFASAEDDHIVCISHKAVSSAFQLMVQLIEHMYYTGAGKINFTNCVVENSLVHGPSNMGGGGFVGNGQGITINNCKFDGLIVAESTNMVVGFVGQGPATIKNSEITSETVIRSIAAGGQVAAYDGQSGGAGAEDNNVFNGTLCCDTEANAKKQNSGATWVKYEGLRASDFNLAEDGTITYTGQNRNFSSVTISESIFQRSDYYKNGNSGQSGANAYLLGGYSCYWEDLIHVDNITSDTLYKVDRVKNIVNVVSAAYADKIACATAAVPNVAWTRYDSYLDRGTGTLYYDGRYSTDDYCGFIGDSATVTTDGTMTPKTAPKGDFYIVIKCFDENGGALGSVTLKYSVDFTSNPA